ncbi:MAG: PilZ domain-containing protein [Polyangiaceae bacterium]
MQEKRKHPRKALALDVTFTTSSGASASAICRDVSLGGAFIVTDSPAAFGAVVRLSLTLPDIDHPVEIEATVRWTTPAGMGVQFGLMGARETHGLVELLRVD